MPTQNYSFDRWNSTGRHFLMRLSLTILPPFLGWGLQTLFWEVIRRP